MPNDLKETAKEKMKKTIESFESDLQTLKAGRANPHMLDRIVADYYGTPTPINQMAGISSPEPRVILVSPWDASALKAIEKAILASDLGINPSNDGKTIRLVVPQLTEERRNELSASVRLVSSGKSSRNEDCLSVFEFVCEIIHAFGYR